MVTRVDSGKKDVAIPGNLVAWATDDSVYTRVYVHPQAGFQC